MTPEELIAWRKAHGLNQGQVADKLGVRRATVTDWERRQHPIPDDLYVRLEKATTPHDVTKRDGGTSLITQLDYPSLFKSTQDVTYLFRYYRGLKNDGKHAGFIARDFLRMI